MKKYSFIQKFGIFYAIMFFLVASLDFIPGLQDQKGYLFGLFDLDTYDNSLHLFSGLWALIASLISTRQAINFFKIFGTLYLLDGIMGLFLGNAFLDFGIFIYGIGDYSIFVKVFANLPHIAIGGIAVFVGYYLSKKPRFIA
jgi:hypothetical protein